MDKRFEPYSDQWGYLANIERIKEAVVDEILKRNAGIQPLGELSITSEQRPWETPAAPQITQKDFMTDMVITKSNMLYFPLAQLSAKVLNHLKRIASFRNPSSSLVRLCVSLPFPRQGSSPAPMLLKNILPCHVDVRMPSGSFSMKNALTARWWMRRSTAMPLASRSKVN